MNENLDLILKMKKEIIESGTIENNDKILVAVSGGPDSMALIHSLINFKNELKKEKNIEYEVAVAHVNHMIREESKYEKKYVEEFCLQNNIKFFYLEINVLEKAKQNKMGTEEFARKARYDFFEKISLQNEYNKIAVAHNSDDNVETILLNIIRGSGLKGICGMSSKFGKIIRPLLNISKKDLTDYCKYFELEACIDKTNNEAIYARNKLRINIIPEITNEINSNFAFNVLRLRNLAIKDEEYLEECASDLVNRSIVLIDEKSISFNFLEILKSKDAMKYRAIRKLIVDKTGNLEGVENIHVKQILELLENNLTKKKYILGNKFTFEIVKKNIARIY